MKQKSAKKSEAEFVVDVRSGPVMCKNGICLWNGIRRNLQNENRIHRIFDLENPDF